MSSASRWRKSITSIAVLVCTAIAVPSPLAVAQDASRISNLRQPSCATCVVSLAKAGDFGSSTGNGALAGSVRIVTRDKSGRVWLTFQDGGPPQVFDSSGRFLRMAGRLGDGPGEFRMPAAIVASDNGNILVFDASHRRTSLFGPDLSIKGGAKVPAAPYDAVAFQGGVFAAAQISTRQNFGHRLHQLSAEGVPVESFTISGLDAPASDARYERYHVAASSAFRCAVREWNLAVGCVTTDSDSSIVLRVTAPWFSDGGRRVVSEGSPQGAHVKAITPLGDAHFAIAVLVPSDRWERAIVKRNGPDGVSIEIDDYDDYFDTVILVFDVRRRQLVTRATVPHAILYAPAAGFFASQQSNSEVPKIALWRVKLTQTLKERR